MLISFKVFIRLAAKELQISLNLSSGRASMRTSNIKYSASPKRGCQFSKGINFEISFEIEIMLSLMLFHK